MGLIHILEQVKADTAKLVGDMLTDVKTHITTEVDRIVSNQEEILAEHKAAIDTEIQQLVEAQNKAAAAAEAQAQALADLQTAVDNLTASEAEKAALQAQLDAATAANADILAQVQSGTADLQADDPAPTP